MKKRFLAFLFLTFTAGTYAQNPDSLTFVRADWNTEQLAPGIEWRYYHFKGKEQLFGKNEYINVLIVDQQKGHTRFAIASKEGEKILTSAAAKQAGAIAAVNGYFYNTEPPYNSLSYLKIDGQILRSNDPIGPFIIIDEAGKLRIASVNASLLAEPTLLGFWPVLVSAGKINVGPSNDLHPRTAIGTDGDRVVLITVDGRRNKSKGMDMIEMASVCQWLGLDIAANLDGGGSTTMYIQGQPDNGIVNHPSDSFLGFSHRGERKVGHSILVLSETDKQ